MRGRNKESPYIVSCGDERRFDEFRVIGTRFYTISESTLNYGENSFAQIRIEVLNVQLFTLAIR